MPPPSVCAYAPARSSKPHPRAPLPDPRFKPGPVFVASGGVNRHSRCQPAAPRPFSSPPIAPRPHSPHGRRRCSRGRCSSSSGPIPEPTAAPRGTSKGLDPAPTPTTAIAYDASAGPPAPQMTLPSTTLLSGSGSPEPALRPTTATSPLVELTIGPCPSRSLRFAHTRRSWSLALGIRFCSFRSQSLLRAHFVSGISLQDL